MMIRKRLAALEARVVSSGLPLAVRAWLRHDLTDEERAAGESEAKVPAAPDWSGISKKGREWLQA